MTRERRETAEKILVTGGTGFLGRRVLRELGSLGLDIIVLGLQGEEKLIPKEARARTTFLEADLTGSLDYLKAELKGVTKVIYLAGRINLIPKIREPVKFIREEFDFNLRGLINLLGVLPSGIKHFTFASSCSVYGPGESPITEDSCIYPPTPYGASKLSGEVCLNFYCRTLGIPLTVLRFSQLYGKGEPHSQFITGFLRACKKGAVIRLNNGGRDVRDILHVEDAARAVARAVVLEKHGIFNISSGKGFTTKEYVTACAIVTHRRPRLEIEAGDGERIIIYDNKAAARELGFEPKVPLLVGLKEMVED